jgi:glycine/D-amino acid oxidase-like deaminating enzyme
VSTEISVAVIGGGILGASLAHQLSQHNIKVTIYERGQLFQEASSKAAGILTFQLFLEHDYKLTSATLAYYSMLKNKGYPVYRKVKGISLFDEHREGEGCVEVIAERLERWGIKHSVYKREEVMKRLPGIKGWDKLIALETWRDYIVDTGTLAQALREELANNGADIEEYNPVLSIAEKDGKIQVESKEKGLEDFDYAVIASGPWSIGITGLEGKVFLYNCQAQSVKTRPPDPDSLIYDYTDEIYLVPGSQHSIIVGDGCRPLKKPEDGLNPDQEITLRVVDVLIERFPDTSSGQLSSVWSSPCEVAMDGIPYVGHVKGSSRLYTVGGLDGYGIMRAPGLASVLVDHIVYGEPIPGLYNTKRLYRYPRPRAIVINELYNPGCGHRNTCIFNWNVLD